MIGDRRTHMESSPLPSFRRPPVVETVLGVQFDPLPAFTNAHLGAFWKTLGPNWPTAQDAPAIPPEFEQFGDDRAWRMVGSINLKLTSKPPARMQIVNAQGTRMVQLQNGRLLYNWVGAGSDDYPRYETIRQ